MRTFSRTTQFKKDVKRAEKRGKNMLKLKAVLDLLIQGNPLPLEFKDHPLRGEGARADLEVLMAIYESSRRRGIVDLPLQKESWALQEMIDAGEI